MDDYTRKMIKTAVAQTCLNVGWSTIHSTPLEILTDLLSDYILGLCKRSNNYAFLFNQTEPNLDHLGLAFQDLGISITELEEFVNYFENNNCPDVPQYPVVKESNLNFLKPGSREVVTRPVHIHEHLPPMYPHLEEQDMIAPAKVQGSSSPPQPEASTVAGDASNVVSPSGSLMRRNDSTDSFAVRRARVMAEEETRTLREISSVMMTTSGFLSHAREGKLPEVRTLIVEQEPEEPTRPSPAAPPQLTAEVKAEPPLDIKLEKKKKKKNHDSTKKVEKEPKNKEANKDEGILLGGISTNSGKIVHDLPDERQVKKLATVKETSKLKVLKPGATKAIALTPDTFTPKAEKKHKAKRANSPAAAMAQFPFGTPKVKIPKTEKAHGRERLHDESGVDNFPDIKLNAEPDKQKLNIFKKISKVKDDHENIKIEFEDMRAQIKSEIDEIAVDIPKRNTITVTTLPETIKEEKVVELPMDIENIHSPSFSTMAFGDEIMPGTPTTPKTPDLPKSLTDHKKKKREKNKEKKERDRHINTSPVSSKICDDNLMAKPKTPDVTVDGPDDHLPPFSFLAYPTGPTLIPPNLASNPLIPQMNLMPFGPRIPPLPPTPTLPLPIPVKEPVVIPPVVQPVAVPSCAAAGAVHTAAPISETQVSPTIKKKDKKDKKNKEKIKKKKDKKGKSKEKSEKKKLKLQKKQKLEEKLKLKKEKKSKKKEAQSQDEKRGDSPSVPKITFKLGPDPQREQSPNPKITFKPLVKKEEDSTEVSKKHAIDLPPHNTINTPKHKGSSTKVAKTATASASSGSIDTSGHHKLLETVLLTKIAGVLSHPITSPIVPKVETYTNEANQLWICPACGRPDDGSSMIACDACDMWYHYICVGIQEAPESDWFCQGCINKRPEAIEKKKKHKKKK